MDTDPIVSFSTPLSGTNRVEAFPAPVLELAYAYYYLLERHGEVHPSELPWVADLHRHEGDLLARLGAFWGAEHREDSGSDLFVMACELGYVKDLSPDRFLDDVPMLQSHLLTRLETFLGDRKKKGWQHYQTFQERLLELQDHERAAEFRANLGHLWDHLRIAWEREGQLLVDEAARAFSGEFEASGDVLSALPAHHFTQFEHAASRIRSSQNSGRIVVVPLYFADSGGFNFEFHETHYIGYGLESESAFEDTASKASEIAGRHKAFADPTRLMLLSLIARWHRMPMTVGDLADQLGVSQPTASGHLKILREAGFVLLEKKGNRSYHQIDDQAIRQALGDLGNALLDYLD